MVIFVFVIVLRKVCAKATRNLYQFLSQKRGSSPVENNLRKHLCNRGQRCFSDYAYWVRLNRSALLGRPIYCAVTTTDFKALQLCTCWIKILKTWHQYSLNDPQEVFQKHNYLTMSLNSTKMDTISPAGRQLKKPEKGRVPRVRCALSF